MTSIKKKRLWSQKVCVLASKFAKIFSHKWTLRDQYDDLPQDWWFASTAIPLFAATIGPLANVLSIAALVTKWKITAGPDTSGTYLSDPQWVTIINSISLACGFLGNVSLLFNFTRRIRYIVALPMTIISWYIATGLLVGIILAMNEYIPPQRPAEIYSQGFWYAVIAASLYMIGASILIINIMGYLLGHYPQHFELDDHQRTLILQTMSFFFWLAGGAAVFSHLMDIGYSDSLYFCDVTILTVGFGDITPSNDVARGLIMPYALFGIIFLGLMIRSINNFAVSASKDVLIKSHQLHTMERTVDRTVSNEFELRQKLGLPPLEQGDHDGSMGQISQYGKVKHDGAVESLKPNAALLNKKDSAGHKRSLPERIGASHGEHKILAKRRDRLIIINEEKDRFNTMRSIQKRTKRFRQYSSLSVSVLAFAALWLLGAVVFWRVERDVQDLPYFTWVYFCYISLLTIGYGDYAPKSNGGRAFFVVWSLVAVPTITILISDMGDTVVSGINESTLRLAEWTILPKRGILKEFLDNHSRLYKWYQHVRVEKGARHRVEHGFDVQNPDLETPNLQVPSDNHATDGQDSRSHISPDSTKHDLACELAVAIKRVANDLQSTTPKKYCYREWVEFTKLIRFTSVDTVDIEEIEIGILDWDWLGEGSPMLADVSETQWVLDRLCESLQRYALRQSRQEEVSAPPHILKLHRLAH